MFKKTVFFLVMLVTVQVSAKESCRPEAFTPCTRGRPTVPLEELTFNRLDKDITTFRNMRSKYLKTAFKKKQKPKNLPACFDVDHTKHYLDSLRKMARKNRGQLCSAHLLPLYDSINSLVSQKSPEYLIIKDENARMALLTQAMEVSEALLYFKNKHTK